MINCPDFSLIRERFTAAWACENHDRPLLLMRGRKKDAPPAAFTTPDSFEERWTDMDYLIRSRRHALESTVFYAESFPLVNPNLGPDFFGATFGCKLHFEKSTSYALPIIEDWDRDGGVSFEREGAVWKKMLDMTRAFTEDSRGDYLVGITDIHSGVDGVVSLRGPENVCMDMYDDPERVCELMDKMRPALTEQLGALHGITSTLGLGCSNWMGVWHPELWYPTSADFICMISEEMFERYILPSIEAEAKLLGGRTIFHLDGPGAVRHLDMLLEIPEIAGIQWVWGAGESGARDWIDLMKKIQAKGKILQTALKREDIDPVFENLRPEGAIYSIAFQPTPEEAAAIIKKAGECAG